MRLEVSTGVKSIDKDLARIQMSILDAMAPLLEKGDSISDRELENVVITAVELLGNANTRILCLRREKA